MTITALITRDVVRNANVMSDEFPLKEDGEQIGKETHHNGNKVVEHYIHTHTQKECETGAVLAIKKAK